MDWFEKLTGFRESGYEETRARLEVEGGRLRSRVNGTSYEIGELELVSLQALRERTKSAGNLPGRVKTSVVTGDVRRMHRSPENAGALATLSLPGMRVAVYARSAIRDDSRDISGSPAGTMGVAQNKI